MTAVHTPDSPNKFLVKHRGAVSRMDRETKNNHRSLTFWFTGLSGSGKSTIAHAVEKQLFFENGMQIYVLDGDNVRHGLCGDLSFSSEGRSENIRRVAELCKIFVDNGTICLCALISPLEADRNKAKTILGSDFREIFISCPLSVCEHRDTKGFYNLAKEGIIQNYTGISSPYEEPKSPDLLVETNKFGEKECTAMVVSFILRELARA